jgi:hypothetical protein
VSSEEIVRGLMAANQRLDQARIKAAAAAQEVAEASALVAAQLRGSAAGPLLAMINKVRENLNAAAGGIGPARSSIEQTIMQAKALGGN